MNEYLDEKNGLKQKFKKYDERKKKQGDVMQRRKDALKRTLHDSQIRSMLDAISKLINIALGTHYIRPTKNVLFT